MIVKVCGITKSKQFFDLVELGVDMVGFNFYRPSKRFINKPVAPDNKSCERVGVFVNPTKAEVELTEVLQLLAAASCSIRSLKTR